MKINPLFQSDIVSRYTSSVTSVPKNTESVYAVSSGSDSVELSGDAQKYAELLRTARNALDSSEEGEDARTDEIMASKQLQVGKTQTVDISVNGLDLMGIDVSVTEDADGNVTGASTNSSNASNIYYILDKCVNILNGDLDSSLLGEMSSVLQSAQSNVLSLDTTIGTSQNSMSTLSDRYTASKLTYKQMKSDAEDADMASAAVELTSAKTTYDAALAAGAKIVQTSLVDFLS